MEPHTVEEVIHQHLRQVNGYDESVYGTDNLSEVPYEPFEDRVDNWNALSEIADELEEFIQAGSVDIADRTTALGGQVSDAIIRVVNAHEDALSTVWRNHTDVAYAEPVNGHGKVYAYVPNGVSGCTVAYDVNSGERVWTYEADETHLKVPVVAEDLVLTQDGSEAVALNPDNGDLVWRTDIGEDAGLMGRFKIIDGSAYVGTTTGSLYRVSLDTGALTTVFTDADSSIDVFDYAQGLFFTNSQARSLDTGEFVWNVETIPCHPVSVDDERAYFKSTDTLFAVDLKTGEECWRREVLSSVGIERGPEGNLLLNQNYELISLDPQSGEEMWRRGEKALLHEATNEPPLSRASAALHNFSVVGDFIVVPTSEGVFTVDAEGTGKWTFEFALDEADIESMVQHRGRLWIGTDIGDLYGVDLETGAETDRYESAGAVGQLTPKGDDLLVMLQRQYREYPGLHKHRKRKRGNLARIRLR